MRSDKPRITFLAFYLLWAERMRWTVPALHVRVCVWLEEVWRDPAAELLELMLPRGHAKSTILEVFNAWLYFNHPTLRILHQSESDGTALKTSRGTQNVLRHHPLTRGLLPDGQGTVEQWWLQGAMDHDSRNASMFAKGILSNVTSSRADFIQNDDIEVPRNIATPEAREKLRYRLSEQVHIAVPGAPKLYIGTPHTHESIYDDVRRLGAKALIVRMFEHEHRIESADKGRYAMPFVPEYVFSGIGEGARLLREGLDYRIEGKALVFAQPPGGLVDCYAGAAWPERFDRKELAKRRRECRTLGEWDSQYQLHAKPVGTVRLDPDRITPYDVQPVLRRANGAAGLTLGGVPLVGAALRWDPSSGKVNSDVSAAALVFQDGLGRRYIHHVAALTGDVAEFAEDGKTIKGGQVFGLCDIIERFHLGNIKLETNGIGGFAPAVLRAAIKQRRLQCGVTEIDTRANKNKRILEGMEPLILSPGMLWAHVDVLDGPLWNQMRDWNPAVRDQPDDYLDAVAAACTDVPERVGRAAGAEPRERADWGQQGGVFEVQVDR